MLNINYKSNKHWKAQKQQRQTCLDKKTPHLEVTMYTVITWRITPTLVCPRCRNHCVSRYRWTSKNTQKI